MRILTVKCKCFQGPKADFERAMSAKSWEKFVPPPPPDQTF